jgi:hypothetical protein
MCIVEQANKTDAGQRAFAVDFERFEEASAAVAPAAHLDDRSLVSIQLVIDARRVRDDVAGETREHVRRHASVVLRGIGNSTWSRSAITTQKCPRRHCSAACTSTPVASIASHAALPRACRHIASTTQRKSEVPPWTTFASVERGKCTPWRLKISCCRFRAGGPQTSA